MYVNHQAALCMLGISGRIVQTLEGHISFEQIVNKEYMYVASLVW